MTEHHDPPVRLKGVGDSLWVTIDPLLPMEQLHTEFTKVFQRLKHMTVNAKVVIDTGGHENSDQIIEDLRLFLKETFKVGQVVTPPSKNSEPDPHQMIEPAPEALASAYQSDTIVIAGRVRSGQTVEARKHLIILGDLNPGAEAITGGDIIILGSLQGKAAAGQPDNVNAIVMALEFRPTQIQIAGFVAAGNPAMTGSVPEFAYIENNKIVVNDYMKASPFRRMSWPQER